MSDKIPFDELTRQRDDLLKKIQIGANYRHYRGDIYKVVGLALREENNSWSVNYERNGIVFNRLADIWLESVENENGEIVRRFEKTEAKNA